MLTMSVQEDFFSVSNSVGVGCFLFCFSVPVLLGQKPLIFEFSPVQALPVCCLQALGTRTWDPEPDMAG